MRSPEPANPAGFTCCWSGLLVWSVGAVLGTTGLFLCQTSGTPQGWALRDRAQVFTELPGLAWLPTASSQGWTSCCWAGTSQTPLPCLMPPGTIPQSQGVQQHRTVAEDLVPGPWGAPAGLRGVVGNDSSTVTLAAQAVPQARTQHSPTQPNTPQHTPTHSQAHRDAFAEGKWENHVTLSRTLQAGHSLLLLKQNSDQH